MSLHATSSETDELSPPPRPIVVRPENATELTLRSVGRKRDLFEQTIAVVKQQSYSPESEKVFGRRWRIGQVGEMLNLTPQWLRQVIKRDNLFPDRATSQNGRSVGYTLQEINLLRTHLKLLPWRAPTEEPAVVAFSNFKGGCGKTTTSVHFAQYMAIRGYRVLYIDCDPQGSATMLFGAQQPFDYEEEGEEIKPTLERYLAREVLDFERLIKTTYFPGIDIVPSDIGLNNSEYHLASRVQRDEGLLNDLRDGIRSSWHNYDVVVLDPPPALGLLSLSVLNAANALVVPMRPSTIDFDSTGECFKMMYANLEAMIAAGYPIFYFFETLLINDMDDKKSAHVDIAEAMKTMFGSEDLLDGIMKDSAEFDSAVKQLLTVYDLDKPMTSHRVYNRCMTYLNRVNEDIETRIRRIWPSQHEKLRGEGKL